MSWSVQMLNQNERIYSAAEFEENERAVATAAKIVTEQLRRHGGCCTEEFGASGRGWKTSAAVWGSSSAVESIGAFWGTATGKSGCSTEDGSRAWWFCSKSIQLIGSLILLNGKYGSKSFVSSLNRTPPGWHSLNSMLRTIFIAWSVLSNTS